MALDNYSLFELQSVHFGRKYLLMARNNLSRGRIAKDFGPELEAIDKLIRDVEGKMGK